MKHNLYFDLLGVHIEHFITSKWTNKTRAAKILGITQNRISEMISGARPANPKIMQTLLLIRQQAEVIKILKDQLEKRE